MYKYLTILSIGVMLLAGARTQWDSVKELPAVVKKAFSQKFPTAKKVNWDMETPTEWEVEFNLEGKEYSANFLSDGKWQETEYEIKKADIPEAIKLTLDEDFVGYEIEEAEISEKSTGSFYELLVEKGEAESELMFDSNGKLISTKAIVEDDED